MSDAVRNYSKTMSTTKRRSLYRRHGQSLAKFFLPLLLVGLVWALWITRDTFPMAVFIARDRTSEAYINNIVDRRHNIVNSAVWRLLPADSPAGHALDLISEDLPVPEWLLNNMVADLCHISAPGVDLIDEVLVVTRMTHIGCLAERIARLLPTVQRDRAGGLNLYHVPDANLYYAVRGRTFLLTPSRSSLIRALTLSPSEALTEEEFQEGVRMAAGADVYCRIAPDAWPFPDNPFGLMAFAMRFENHSARVMVQADFTQAFQEEYAALLPMSSADSLPAPFDAVAAVSIDLGRPLPDFLEALAQVFSETELLPPSVLNFSNDEEQGHEITSMMELIASAIQASGSRVRLGWFGVDAYEMFPVPLIAATLDTDADRTLMLFETIPETFDTTEDFSLFPELNEELMLAHAPFVGGPNISPTLAKFGAGAIISSSTTLAMQLQESPRLVSNFRQQGNLYFTLKPLEAAQAIVDMAREFAHAGLLRGHSEESLEAAAASWLDAAAAVQETALLASWADGQLVAEVKISMAGSTIQPPPATDTASEEMDSTAS